MWRGAPSPTFRLMKRLRRAVVPALLLALAPAVPAAAAPGSPDHFGQPVLLALGDSVAAGVGAVPKTTGYPEQLLGALRAGYNTNADKATPGRTSPLEIRNVSMGGATTTSLLSAQLPAALDLIRARNEDRDPKNDVEVITVTIGGNDVFNPVIGACLLAPSPAGCQPTTDRQLAQVRANLTEILTRLTEAAGRRTEVVVTTYYNPLGSCALGQRPGAVALGDVVLEGGSIPGLLTLEDGLNDVIREAAAASGAQVAELYGELTAGQYVGGADCLHPNLSGHTTIAEQVYATLAD